MDEVTMSSQQVLLCKRRICSHFA